MLSINEVGLSGKWRVQIYNSVPIICIISSCVHYIWSYSRFLFSEKLTHSPLRAKNFKTCRWQITIPAVSAVPIITMTVKRHTERPVEKWNHEHFEAKQKRMKKWRQCSSNFRSLLWYFGNMWGWEVWNVRHFGVMPAVVCRGLKAYGQRWPAARIANAIWSADLGVSLWLDFRDETAQMSLCVMLSVISFIAMSVRMTPEAATTRRHHNSSLHRFLLPCPLFTGAFNFSTVFWKSLVFSRIDFIQPHFITLNFHLIRCDLCALIVNISNNTLFLNHFE